MKNKNVKKLLKGSEESYLIATKNGTGSSGLIPDVLTQFVLLTKNLRRNIPDKMIKEAFELSFKTEKELEEKLLKSMKELSKKL